ncbi:RNA polymerase sigma C factor [Bacillus sp. NRRL B-14911]|nr:RNA polymerase sigma C factor [Bacillus sp. NRRL B-14911]
MSLLSGRFIYFLDEAWGKKVDFIFLGGHGKAPGFWPALRYKLLFLMELLISVAGTSLSAVRR